MLFPNISMPAGEHSYAMYYSQNPSDHILGIFFAFTLGLKTKALLKRPFLIIEENSRGKNPLSSQPDATADCSYCTIHAH